MPAAGYGAALNRCATGRRFGAALLGVAMMATASVSCNGGPIAENLGYLRASSERDGGSLTVFDADTFAPYRTASMPDDEIDHSPHRLERDAQGRIWIAYTQESTGKWRVKEEVRVFSPQGKLRHKIKTGCGPPVSIVFSESYAFLVCLWSGFYAQVLVIDLESMDLVKTFEKIAPLEAERRGDGAFFATAAVSIDGVIVVIGATRSPNDYKKLSRHSGGTTMAVAIDPETLTVRGYQTGLPPGVRVLDAVPVNGQVWLLNFWSNMHERPPRTDVYVLDPHTMEITDRFNLPQPYPQWGSIADDGSVYVFHQLRWSREHQAGRRPAITRVDPITREMEHVKIKSPGLVFYEASGMDVYRGRPCITLQRGQNDGLWCIDNDGAMRLEIEQENAAGVLFAPAAGK